LLRLAILLAAKFWQATGWSSSTFPTILAWDWTDFVSERHVVIVKRVPTETPNMEWCEFDERPGPAPPGTEDDACTVYLTRDG
jgi:hypothetical protein